MGFLVFRVVKNFQLLQGNKKCETVLNHFAFYFFSSVPSGVSVWSFTLTWINKLQKLDDFTEKHTLAKNS